MFGGMYLVVQGRNKRANLQKEKVAGRIAMQPVLQAEADRMAIRRTYQDIKAEAAIMSEVTGWEVGKSVYKTDLYVPPAQPVKLGKKV